MAKVVESCIFEAPIEDVWNVIRDFNGHDKWHPAVSESTIEGNQSSDQVGCVRIFRLNDGSELREQLLSLSDESHEFRYCLLDTPIPLFNYVARVRLKPVTVDSTTFCEWAGKFNTRAESSSELVELVREGIYKAGFEAIKLELQKSKDSID